MNTVRVLIVGGLVTCASFLSAANVAAQSGTAASSAQGQGPMTVERVKSGLLARAARGR